MADRNYTIVLASGSPRRKEIMNTIGAKYIVCPSNKEEKMDSDNPSELVMKLARMKALDVADNQKGDSVIIGADTVVAYKDTILGKPKTHEQAFEMIKTFQGDTHYVYTGVSIVIMNDGEIVKEKNFFGSTGVVVCDMTDEEIRRYAESDEPMDKAGAYAIQGAFAPYIDKIEGDYYNIVGFPITLIYHSLREEGINIISM